MLGATVDDADPAIPVLQCWPSAITLSGFTSLVPKIAIHDAMAPRDATVVSSPLPSALGELLGKQSTLSGQPQSPTPPAFENNPGQQVVDRRTPASTSRLVSNAISRISRPTTPSGLDSYR